MKKILIFAVVLLIVSASVFGSGQKESNYSIEDFQGTWEQVGGYSVLTVSKNNFEIVNMDDGFAGYGTFSLYRTKEGIETIKFIVNWLFNLNSTKPSNSPNGARLKDFQRQAWEDFRIPVEKRDNSVVKDYGFSDKEREGMGGSEGGFYRHFELNGDNLNLISYYDTPGIFNEIKKAIASGEFVRVK